MKENILAQHLATAIKSAELKARALHKAAHLLRQAQVEFDNNKLDDMADAHQQAAHELNKFLGKFGMEYDWRTKSAVPVQI